MTNKITFLSLCLFLFSQLVFSQFTRDDIQFWIGEGDSEAYLVVDFRDDTTDPSFAWGFRFNEEEDLSFKDILMAVEAAEPKFTTDFTGGFLEDITYNHHSRLSGEPDWWSTWSGTDVENMEMNSGVSEELENGRWYGISYGFSPTKMPTVTYPAYSSLWFSIEELDYALGEGENTAVIVVDFVDSEDNDSASFAWKIKFDGTISVKQALTLISDSDNDFQANFDGIDLLDITYKAMRGDAWLSYKGTDMSNWVLSEMAIELTDRQWFGFAHGEEYSRRPFTPIPAEENPVLSNGSSELDRIAIYPNPATSELHISIAQNVEVKIYDTRGALLYSGKNDGSRAIDVSLFQQGVYILNVDLHGNTEQYRFIKK